MGELRETDVPRPKSEATVKLLRADNGWMLIFDDNGNFEKDGVSPYTRVKEGELEKFNGLFDEFIDTFLLGEVWGDDDYHDNREFEISMVVERIK